MDKITYDPVKVTTVVSEGMLAEILLVFGSARNYGEAGVDRMKYWQEVWEWLDNRYPNVFVAGEFPEDWTSDADHEQDMEVLTSIYMWQKSMRTTGALS